MESSPRNETSEIGSDIFMILVTIANLIFFAFFHKYIAWFNTAPDGSVIRLSMLTDEYFIWLPIAIAASILAIVAYATMLFYNNERFRMTVEIIVITAGIVVATSLASIFPFDFSVIPNATAVNIVPPAVRTFFILLAIFYVVTVLRKTIQLRRYLKNKKLD